MDEKVYTLLLLLLGVVLLTVGLSLAQFEDLGALIDFIATPF